MDQEQGRAGDGAGAKAGGMPRWGWWALGTVALIAAIGEIDPPAQKAAPAKTAAAAPSADDVDDMARGMTDVARDAIFTTPISGDATVALVEAAALKRCEGKAFCQVYGWADPAAQAKAWPMLPREVERLSFRYAINRSTGYEAKQWFCGSIGAKADCQKP